MNTQPTTSQTAEERQHAQDGIVAKMREKMAQERLEVEARREKFEMLEEKRLERREQERLAEQARKQEQERAERAAHWTKQGLCDACGGIFGGAWIFRKCQACKKKPPN